MVIIVMTAYTKVILSHKSPDQDSAGFQSKTSSSETSTAVLLYWFEDFACDLESNSISDQLIAAQMRL